MSAALRASTLLALLFGGCSPREPGPEGGAAAGAGGEEAFVDATARAGIDFVHVHGGFGERYMVETLGSGAGFLDHDGDGDLDVYLVQSGALPGFSLDRPYGNALYRNDGDGNFTDVTAAAGVGDTGYGMGCAFADYDNDGWIDIYVTNFGPNRLYRNRGDGAFEDRTAAARVGDARWSTGAAFADYDGDGDLDLYVANYVEHTLANNIRCGPADTPQYCGPQAYPGTPDVLYENLGDGTFRDATAAAGMDQPIANHFGSGLGVAWTDYDDDGDPDLYVANDDAANFLYRNRGDGTFEDATVTSGAAYNEAGKAEASMGVDAGDYDHDGRFDLFLTHLAFETNTLYRNAGGGAFEDRTFDSGLGPPSLLYLGFGTNFFDYDGDGWLDVFVANGHILDNVHLTLPSTSYEQEAQLFRNLGNGRFEDRSRAAGAALRVKRVGRGAAFGDYDNDGDVDVLMSQSNRSAVLLRNEVGNRSHWVLLDLRGRRRNLHAIGARARITAGDLVQVEEVRTGTSYLSQNDLRLHFGLGSRDRVDRVEIRWPNGHLQTLPGDSITVDAVNRIVEPEDSPALAGWRR